MSYAVRRPADPSGPRGSGTDAPPTTATVLDFICLFTHDLRRKQKRWQDGRLKYHTFNKRVMVYDDRGNFIGDAHWQAGGDLAEGEELELDRGAAIVQVADCTGSREQDLTEILDKRAREVEKRRASAVARTPAAARTASTTAARGQDGQAPTHFQLNHRPLSMIVPQSPGPIGRAAIPNHSPFEARQAGAGGGQERGPKRRRVGMSPPSKAGYARSLFGATLTLSQSPIGGTVAARAAAAALRERTSVQERHEEKDKGEMGDGVDEDVVMLDGPPRPRVRTTKLTHFPTTPDIDTSSARTVREASSKTTKAAASARKSSHEEPQRLEQLDDPSRVEPKMSKQRKATDDKKASARPTTKDRRSAAPKGRTHDEEDDTEETETRIRGEQAKKSNLSKIAAPAHKENVIQIQSGGGDQPEPPKKTEPRTELRIKSRQRRGLLMVSEKKQQQKATERRRSETPGSSGAGFQNEALPNLRDTDRQSRRREESVAQEAIEAAPEPSELDPPSHIEPVAESDSESETTLLDRARKPHAHPVFDDPSGESDAPPVYRRRKDTGTKALASDDETDTQSSHSPPARKTRRRRSSTHATSDDAWDIPPSPPKKRHTRQKERGDADSVPKAVNPAPSGPRITKMARKSVKSKEIIGFIPPAGDDLVPAPFATATDRIGLQAHSVLSAAPAPATVPTAGPPLQPNCDAVDNAFMKSTTVAARSSSAAAPTAAPTAAPDNAEEHVNTGAAKTYNLALVSLLESDSGSAVVKPAVAAATPSSDTRTDLTTTATNPPPHAEAAHSTPGTTQDTGPKHKISNPATRGRKAATKQHAAGQAPQSLVPMEPAAPVRVARAAPVEPKKKQDGNLPGFSAANGGAWSRHAEDLLGMGRPTRGRR